MKDYIIDAINILLKSVIPKVGMQKPINIWQKNFKKIKKFITNTLFFRIF